jgi:hypothetical protein
MAFDGEIATIFNGRTGIDAVRRKQVNSCEGWYARLVREWNQSIGIQ